jgi:tetratricopeptide (TPR) repeat protein
MEPKMLELRATWPRLTPDQSTMADALRMFVITWDPLELHPPRPAAFGTVNTGPLELAVYLPLWSPAEQGTTIAAFLSAVASAAVATAAAQRTAVTSGRYPQFVRQGAAPDLLSDLTSGAALGPAAIELVSLGWDDIGLGAIADIVQQAFGPVDLDRSKVELSGGYHPGCPACQGGRFGFPAELAEARETMCQSHRSEAQKVIRGRMNRAKASNAQGWAALTDASERLGRPHLPDGLATKLANADEAMYVTPEPRGLASRARLVIEAASWFPGRPQDLAIALGEDPAIVVLLPDWLMDLVFQLGRAGLREEAIAVAEALSRVDPENSAMFDGDVAIALAEGGFAEDARARVADNLARWPRDLWVRIHAGDAFAALGDRAGARAHFQAALAIAEEADDIPGRSDAMERIISLEPRSGAETNSESVAQRQNARPPQPVVLYKQRKRQSRAQRKGRR